MRQMLLVQGVPLEIIMIQKTTYHLEEAIFPYYVENVKT